ncbi:MAG: hypothetical protein QM667_08540 [Asticcacaulis sp.]
MKAQIFRISRIVRRDNVIGLASSFIIHVALLVCLLSGGRDVLMGAAGLGTGATGTGRGDFAFDVEYFPEPGSVKDVVASEAIRRENAPPATELHDRLPDSTAQVEAVPDTTDTPKTGAITTLAGQTGGAAPGDIHGSQTLLKQIARCLPKDVRPDLRPATLTLALDETGRLRAVPALSVDTATLTRDQLRYSNLIVQASLQCGPYITGTSAEATLELTADFSQVGADAQ